MPSALGHVGSAGCDQIVAPSVLLLPIPEGFSGTKALEHCPETLQVTNISRSGPEEVVGTKP